jgi:DnaJ-class molecular chaperone
MAMIPCPNCSGAKVAPRTCPDHTGRKCTNCSGTNQVWGTCGTCNGNGEIAEPAPPVEPTTP